MKRKGVLQLPWGMYTGVMVLDVYMMSGGSIQEASTLYYVLHMGMMYLALMKERRAHFREMLQAVVGVGLFSLLMMWLISGSGLSISSGDFTFLLVFGAGLLAVYRVLKLGDIQRRKNSESDSEEIADGRGKVLEKTPSLPKTSSKNHEDFESRVKKLELMKSRGLLEEKEYQEMKESLKQEILNPS
jgi:hypothetical protein